MHSHFRYYSKQNYFLLSFNFNSITAVLTKKLIQLGQLGYNPLNIFLFGFSFGAHVVFEAAFRFGSEKIGRVDCCDPAGPLFPHKSDSVKHAFYSAIFVQCMHTSDDKGTKLRFCKTDVNLGECGRKQPGATIAPYFSHGLCPIMYNNAFNVDFNLVPKAKVDEYFNVNCTPEKNRPDVTTLPNCTMGFRFNTQFPLGEYYALTGKYSPYNVK